MEAEGDDRGVGFLDVRKRDEFLKLHVKGSAHIPDVAVADRLFELPPPQGGPDEPAVRLVLVHDLDEAQLADLTAFLVEKGYTVVESVRGSELVVGGRFQVATGKEFGCLWRPNPALARCWQRIKEIHPDPRAERLTCIDLAAGNGRDCLFVAREGWHALGIDYLERQWSKIDAITARALEELPDEELREFGSIRSNNMDLEKEAPDVVVERVLALHNNEPATLVIISRYLHRPHFPHLHKLVAKNGLLLFHTFLVGAESVGRKTPTKARFLLNPGELRAAFQDEFEVLEDSVILLPDKRPTSW